MKKIIIMITLFFICLNVYAIDIPACTDSEMARLKEIANNVEFKRKVNISTYDFDEEISETEATYDISIVNFNNDLKIQYKNVLTGEKTITSKTTNINGLIPGNTITFSIYSYTSNLCTNRLLRTVTVKLPIYNLYSYFNKDKCQLYPDFKYCQEYLNIGELYYEDIDEMFEEYINGKTKTNVSEKKIPYTMIYSIAGGVVVLLIIVISIVIIKKKKKKKKDDL